MSESAAVAVHRRYKLSFLKTLRSEWIKLFTLRSSWWLMVITIVTSIGFSVFMAFMLYYNENYMADVLAQNGVPREPGAMGMWSQAVVQGCGMTGQLVFVILSVLIITNEYSSGMIRSTMTVAPRRIRVLIAKMFVIIFTAILVFAISVAGSWGLGYLFLRDSVMVDTTLTSLVSLRILGGFVLEMVLVSLMCFGLGAWIRSTAGGIGAAVFVVMLLPLIRQMIVGFLANPEPTGWRKWLVDGSLFLPTIAGGLITEVEPSSSLLGPWEGLGVLGGWALLAIIIAFIATARRDV